MKIKKLAKFVTIHVDGKVIPLEGGRGLDEIPDELWDAIANDLKNNVTGDFDIRDNELEYEYELLGHDNQTKRTKQHKRTAEEAYQAVGLALPRPPVPNVGILGRIIIALIFVALFALAYWLGVNELINDIRAIF